MSDTIKVSIELADQAAQKALSDFISKSATADKNVKKLGDTGKSSFNDITVGIGKSIGVYDIFAGNIAANVVTKGFEIMAQAASQLFNVLVVDGIKAAQESEVALNDLNNALGRSGIYSEKTSKEFQDLAKQLQATTTYEDDFILKNVALIQSLAQLDKDGLKRTTKAAIDLSAAIGIDLESASTALAKAANGNYVALGKMGVQFEKTGSQAQAFQNALASVEEKFGGAAASKINTFSGALEQAKNFFGDLQEEIGNLIISNPAVIAALSEIGNVIKETVTAFSSGKNSSQELARSFIFLIDSASMVIKIFDGLVTTITSAWDLIVSVTAGQLAILIAPFALFSDTAKAIFDGLTEQIGENLNKIGDKFSGNSALSGITNTLDRMSSAAELAMENVASGATKAAPKVVNLSGKTKELTEAQKKLTEETNKYVSDLAKKNQYIEAAADAELATFKANNELKLIAQTENDEATNLQKLESEQVYLEFREQMLSQTLEKERERINSSTVMAETKAQAILTIERNYSVESIKLKKQLADQQDAIDKARTKQETDNRQYALSSTASMFSALGSLAAIGGKKNFEIVKAFNIAASITNAYAAITKTLSDGGPYPFNIVSAAAIGVSAFANVASISQQQAPSFEQGGIVPGTSFSGDRVRANVNSGEMILNRNQQAELFNVANGSSTNSGLAEQFRSLSQEFKQLLSQPIMIQVDGRELFNITRAQLASGRSY